MNVFYLPQPAVYAPGRLPDCLRKQLRRHKVGAGTGGQIAAVAQQLHAAHIDFPVALYGIFYGIPRFRKGRRVQDHKVKDFPAGLELRAADESYYLKFFIFQVCAER